MIGEFEEQLVDDVRMLLGTTPSMESMEECSIGIFILVVGILRGLRGDAYVQEFFKKSMDINFTIDVIPADGGIQ